MARAQHRLAGYDRISELEKFELVIPRDMFREVCKFLYFDGDDPEVVGCYELTLCQARKISDVVHGPSMPTTLTFFLEAYTEHARAD